MLANVLICFICYIALHFKHCKLGSVGGITGAWDVHSFQYCRPNFHLHHRGFSAPKFHRDGFCLPLNKSKHFKTEEFMVIRVVIADDHLIVRQGLVSLLEREPDIQVVGQAGDGLELVNLVRRLRPNVAVTDITMPGLNGYEAIQRILARKIKPKMICLSVHGEPRLIRAVLDMGVSGYLVKGCAFHELILAVRTAMDNQIYLSPDLAKSVAQHCRSVDANADMPAHMNLTTREREIVQLFAEGHNTRQIGERLHISEKTVATHRKNVMGKLEITGIAELTRYAIREGICSVCAPCPAIKSIGEDVASQCRGSGANQFTGNSSICQ